MPGMLTAEEMDRLAQAKGPQFDKLFLEYTYQAPRRGIDDGQ